LADDRYSYPGTFSIYRCPACGFGQLQSLIVKDQLEDLYTNYYPRKVITTASVRAGAQAHGSWLLGNPDIYGQFARPGLRMLDIGCGDGASLLMMQAKGAEAYGTELDRNVMTPAKELGLTIHIGDIETAPYPDHSFDVITLSQLLEHVENPIQFLHQVKRKLKPGGKIVITTPRFGGLQQRMSGRCWINWHIPFHVNFFSRTSLLQLARLSGLRVMRMKTFTPHTWVTLQLLNLKQPNRYWHPRPTGVTLGQYLRQLGVFQSSHLLLAHAFGWLSVPYYRLLDAVRGGDSWFIVLTV
jgi:2-polyprenyl-3-methyl-5-hydroxy-6-metoxy-1,4-benzoquinol methylase